MTRQGFYRYLEHQDDLWKYEGLAKKMEEIVAEDACNDTYDRCRMREALALKYPAAELPCERTVCRIMERIGLSHRPKRKPHGITKADREARKSDDLLKRGFTADKPCEKCVTDITEIPAKDGKLHISALFDCYDLCVLGLSIPDNMRAELCVETVKNAYRSFPDLRGGVIHSDRGSQYTSTLYRAELSRCGIVQSMNSAGGRCGMGCILDENGSRIQDHHK